MSGHDTTPMTPTAPAPRPPARGRVAIAMSGGVDSSVAAALLIGQGWDVVGVHMKLNELPDEEKRGKSCCSLDDSLDARQVCAQLGIPFYVLDFTREFKAGVLDYFVDAYRTGTTPNPCVMCNRTVKQGLLLERIREFGCERLATGHYAGLREDPASGRLQIVKARDRRKDQTYFLWGTRPEDLPYLMYPLADYEKSATRELAAGHRFITWDKPDSQEVCFVPKDYRDFLRPRFAAAPPPPGDFVDRDGRVLGRHQGLPYYTIGQRRGLGLGGERPWYVVALRRDTNEVVLGGDADLLGSAMTVRGVHWVSCDPPASPRTASVKVRYVHAGTAAQVTPLGEGRARVEFAEPVRAITPGQAAVFYDGDVLLGGGWIEG
jgi:tRNA-specific 2-thiouridylase